MRQLRSAFGGLRLWIIVEAICNRCILIVSVMLRRKPSAPYVNVVCWPPSNVNEVIRFSESHMKWRPVWLDFRDLGLNMAAMTLGVITNSITAEDIPSAMYAIDESLAPK